MSQAKKSQCSKCCSRRRSSEVDVRMSGVDLLKLQLRKSPSTNEGLCFGGRIYLSVMCLKFVVYSKV